MIRELGPLRRVMRHEANALKIVQSSSRPAIEDMAATTQDRSIEDYLMSSVFENAVDERAIDEVLLVQLQAFAFDRSAIDNFHGMLPKYS